RKNDRAGVVLLNALVETEGGCVPAGAPTLKSVRVKQRFFVLMNTYLVNRVRSRIYSPQRRAKALDGIYGHQVAAGKRLVSLDEQLMLIIPVNLPLQTSKEYDRWNDEHP
ncbi:hypothetical protein L195_g042596, partial [Trifolium pratense]